MGHIKEMIDLLQMEGVSTVIADQCMYGLRTWKVRGEALAKKPTKFATNSECVKLELGVRCDKKHVHQPLLNNGAKLAEKYPKKLCTAMCRGMSKHKRNEERERERERVE